jgi:hypothetical protein
MRVFESTRECLKPFERVREYSRVLETVSSWAGFQPALEAIGARKMLVLAG